MPNPSLSAVSVESTTIDNATSSTTSVTIDATTTILVACVGNGGTTAGGPSGATYNGVAMTASRTDSWTTADNGTSAFFYMVNPPIGTANGVVSWSAGAKTNNGGGVTWVQLKDVDTASPIDASEGANFDTPVTSLNDSVVVVTAGSFILACGEGRSSGGLTVVSDVQITDRVADNDGLAVMYRADATAASNNMNFTTASDRGCISIIALKPLAGGSGLSHVLSGKFASLLKGKLG